VSDPLKRYENKNDVHDPNIHWLSHNHDTQPPIPPNTHPTGATIALAVEYALPPPLYPLLILLSLGINPKADIKPDPRARLRVGTARGTLVEARRVTWRDVTDIGGIRVRMSERRRAETRHAARRGGKRMQAARRITIRCHSV
ncbi:hypothetical protein AAMO2058_000764800, partial [Amorphochlora amoebiformis]